LLSLSEYIIPSAHDTRGNARQTDIATIVASLFDSWFGFILWPIAYYVMNKHRKLSDPWHLLESILCVLLMITGEFVNPSLPANALIRNAGMIKRDLPVHRWELRKYPVDP
jgi:hypothetical protein